MFYLIGLLSVIFFSLAINVIAKSIKLNKSLAAEEQTDSAVDITALFPADASGKQYHTAHRALNAGVIRPLWHKVTIVVLKDATVTGRIVEGESTTTGKGIVLVVPVLVDAKVPALVK